MAVQWYIGCNVGVATSSPHTCYSFSAATAGVPTVYPFAPAQPHPVAWAALPCFVHEIPAATEHGIYTHRACACSGWVMTASSRAAAAAKEVQQWRDEDLPWYEANLQISSQTLRLHNEIVEINSLLRPVPAEDAQRLEAKGLLDALITAIFPTARLEVLRRVPALMHACP